jgi:hypothetical protein
MILLYSYLKFNIGIYLLCAIFLFLIIFIFLNPKKVYEIKDGDPAIKSYILHGLLSTALYAVVMVIILIVKYLIKQ